MLCLLIRDAMLLPVSLALSTVLIASEPTNGTHGMTLGLAPSTGFSTLSPRVVDTFMPALNLQRSFGSPASNDSALPLLLAGAHSKDETKSNSLAGWLESSLSPIYQWLQRVRGDKSEVSTATSDEQTPAFQLPKLPSEKLHQAVSAATERHQGVLMGVKRLTIDQAVYRIKILKHSGELRTLDYSEEQDKFISEEDESWYANTVD